MRTALLIVHIASAAAWFGHKLMVPRDIRMSLRSGDVASAMVERMRGMARLGIGSALGTAFSGIGLLWLAGWSASTTLGLGIFAAIAAIVVGASRARPAWEAVERAVEHGDLATGGAFGRRFSAWLHLESVLWMAALAAMVVG